MIQNAIMRRLTVVSLGLIIMGLFYLFPSKNEEIIEIPQLIKYQNDISDATIFLLDKNDYVARANVVYKSKDVIEKAKEMIRALSIGSDKSEYLPEGFKALIPAKTKLIELSIKDGLCKLNFSKELLNIEEKYEEKMIEAIVFSLTSIEGIDKVMIFIDSEQLFYLPHSKKPLPLTLNRDYGINKIYDLDKITDTTKTTIYYLSKYKDYSYFVPVTKITNNQMSKIEIIIKELKGSPTTQTNLMSYLKASIELKSYEILENEINLSFNNALFSGLGKKSISEEVKYSILLSIKDNYQVEKVSFIVDEEKIDDFILKNLS